MAVAAASYPLLGHISAPTLSCMPQWAGEPIDWCAVILTKLKLTVNNQMGSDASQYSGQSKGDT